MALNLNSMVTQLLTPDVIAKIASFLGIDRRYLWTQVIMGTRFLQEQHNTA
jgi:hypothetical protein